MASTSRSAAAPKGAAASTGAGKLARAKALLRAKPRRVLASGDHPLRPRQATFPAVLGD